MAGIGAAINTGKVGRGDSVAVIGCGGVGDAAIAGAGLAGASTIIAVDVDERKLGVGQGVRRHPHRQLARERRRRGVQALTGGFGADVVVDAVGRPETFKQAFYARDLAGTVVLVGVPTPDMRRAAAARRVRPRRRAKSSWYGDCLPSPGLPDAVDLHLQGRLPLDKFVSETIGLDDVEAAFHKMHSGEVLRSVVVSVSPVEHVVTSGTFSLDGGTWDVDNNVWLVGDDNEVIVVDAAHDAETIVDAVGGRRVVAVVCTHAHDDHVNRRPRCPTGSARRSAAPGRGAAVGDGPPGPQARPRAAPTATCYRGRDRLHVLATPGHSPGSTCLYVPELGMVFTGDTLFQGGPGATGRSFSSSTRSSTRSATGCSRCPATPGPHRPRRLDDDRHGGCRTWRSGSPGATDDGIPMRSCLR